MKHKILVFCCTIFFLTGCKKFLDKQPLASFTDDDFWTSESSVRAFAMGYYADRFPGFGNNDAGGSMSIRETLNDDFTSTSLPGFASLVTNNGGAWDNYFTDIRKDNIFVDRVTSMTGFPDSATARHWIGIARFFRALDYSNFVFDFGAVPYYSKPLSDNDSDLFRPRDPVTFVMDNVLADFQYASSANRLPTVQNRSSISHLVSKGDRTPTCFRFLSRSSLVGDFTAAAAAASDSPLTSPSFFASVSLVGDGNG